MFTKGFSYIGIHVKDLSIFIGEIVIFVSLIIHSFIREISYLAKNRTFKWLAAWFFLGCLLCLVNITRYPIVGIAKDFATVYYSIFLIFGYAFFDNLNRMNAFLRMLGHLFIIHALWGMCFPFREKIMELSPKLLGFMPIFSFRNDADSVVFIGGILYFLLLSKQLHWSKFLSSAAVIMQVVLLLVFKMSAGYLACIIALTYLLTVKKEKILLKITAVIMATIIIGFVATAGYYAISDLSKKGPADFIFEEFDTMVHYSKAGTNMFRILWWKDIVGQVICDPIGSIIGKGFGPSLVMGDYSKSGIIERSGEEIGGLSKSPHSIEMTVLARMGILGLLLWVAFNSCFYIYMFKGIDIAVQRNSYNMQNILIWIAAFLLAVTVSASFSVLLESPFTAIPYFFFMGLGIAAADSILKRQGGLPINGRVISK